MNATTPLPFGATDGIQVRRLESYERPYTTSCRSVPLVFEAEWSSDARRLCAFLKAHSAAIVASIYEHGAILLRGFTIRSDAAFARAIASIDGMLPMQGYFMSEPGRRKKMNPDVFHTNAHFKTGGGFSRLGEGFHSENYYSIDTPAFQCFWCKRRPWLGGETALIHAGRAYGDLSDDVRAKLEQHPVCTPTAWPISAIAATYGVSEVFIGEFFRELGLPLVQLGGDAFLVLQKPSVYRHPYTLRPTLSANLSAELAELGPALQAFFAPEYQGWPWAFHRLAWRSPALHEVLSILESLPALLRHHPNWMGHAWARFLRPKLPGWPPPEERERRRTYQQLTGELRLEHWLSSSEVQALAAALWKHCSVFSWRRDDILILDNLQLMHAGMPGLGPRELGVALCNPIALEYPIVSSPTTVHRDPDYVAVDTRLKQARIAS